jgi:hypothetical protein
MATTLARFAWRRNTATQWATNNEVLLAGEPGVETNTGAWKLGDGATSWNTLPYQSGSAGPVNVRTYGAKGDGTTDDTAAIDAAFAVRGSIYLPAGNYLYNGTGYAGTAPVAIGEDRGKTTVTLGTGKSFLTPTGVLVGLHVEEINFVGGFGAIRHTYTGSNVTNEFVVTRCRFKDYTGTAISTLASDMPYWRVRNNTFDAANFTTTIGVALGGLTDLNEIESNEFLRNRVHVKLGHAGCNVSLRHNDFIRFGGTGGNPRIDLWVVPYTSTTNGGQGLVARDNKFGNENLDAGDYRVVYADDDTATGADFATRFPNLSANSVGYITGHVFDANMLAGAGVAPLPFVYSTTPNVIGCQYRGILNGTVPTYVLQYRTPPAADRLNSTNLYGPFTHSDTGANTEVVAPLVTNDAGGYLTDPGQVFTRAAVQPYPGGGDATGYVRLLTTAVGAFNAAAGATQTAAADSLGGAEAVELTLTTTAIFYAGITAPTVAEPVWVEFDLAAGTTGSATQIGVQLQYTANGAIHWRRIIPITAGWRRKRFLVYPREATAAINLVFYGSTATGQTGTVKLGRVRVYHAAEPQIDGAVKLSAANTFTAAQTITSAASPLILNRTGGGDSGLTLQANGAAQGQLRASTAGRVKVTNGAAAIEYIGWDTAENTYIRNGDAGGGAGVIAFKNSATMPTTNPVAGGILYVENGALKWRGSSGTVTTIGPA